MLPEGSSDAHLNVSQTAFPSPSMQNQIHELAKTLPPPRKQNTACDACRSRKVKCQRLPGQEKCQHCTSKNYPCTHYVQQATSEKKRSSAVSRRPRGTSSSSSPPAPANPPPSSTDSGSPGPPHHAISSPRGGFYPTITLNTPTRDVLTYLFSPPENSSEAVPFSRIMSPYTIWGDLAYKLEDEQFRAEFALDLVEIFFQIVHTRLPLLNPVQFRLRLQLQGSAAPSPTYNGQADKQPLHPALFATVIAWGTKFSEHPLLVADRKRSGGQSTLARTLVDRARDLAETLKAHRIPTHEHVVIGLLLEPLQSQTPDDPNGFHTFWLRAAIRHLMDLQINHKSVASTIPEAEARGTMIFAWWMACISDAYGSMYYRHKPVLDDDDYDIDFYTVDELGDSTHSSSSPSPRDQLEFLGYYRAAHSLARTARQMSRALWRPATESDGVPLDIIMSFESALSEWSGKYLKVVGVPKNFEGEWDFVSAVSSCASDATYHVMWIILFNALDEFGVKETNEVVRMGNSSSSSVPNDATIDLVKKKIADEAMHGALRISGLAGVLTSNGYLRLDPAVMLVSCQLAGMLLARLGRPEVSNCIAGLEQYSQAYEEAGEFAHEIHRVFLREVETDFNHMASVTSRYGVAGPTTGDAMVIDDAMEGC